VPHQVRPHGAITTAVYVPATIAISIGSSNAGYNQRRKGHREHLKSLEQRVLVRFYCGRSALDHVIHSTPSIRVVNGAATHLVTLTSSD
jgi:hypothetical protein